jgi:NAD-dependent SIR2 family protein deacetylase
MQPARKGATVEAYCVKCRKKTTMQDPKEETLKNGRRAMMGKCPACGTKLCRILGK